MYVYIYIYIYYRPPRRHHLVEHRHVLLLSKDHVSSPMELFTVLCMLSPPPFRWPGFPLRGVTWGAGRAAVISARVRALGDRA